MRVAVTGTPGTGKSSACEELSKQGCAVVDLNRLAAEEGLVKRLRERGAPGLVDVKRLRGAVVEGSKTTFMYSHFAHLLEPDMTVVLRCSPRILRSRLEARGWTEEKIRENLEAEAIDIVTIEAMQGCSRVYEIDTTSLTPSEAAHQILEIVRGKVEGHEPGRIDWSEEILSWY